MYLIDQEIANAIANNQTMKYPLMAKIFQATEQEAEEMEMKLREEVKDETGDDLVARSVVAYLPLILENEAITNYINQTRNRQLRAMMPEILTVEEASLIAQRDYMMNQNQTEQTRKMLKQYQVGLLNNQPQNYSLAPDQNDEPMTRAVFHELIEELVQKTGLSSLEVIRRIEFLLDKRKQNSGK